MQLSPLLASLLLLAPLVTAQEAAYFDVPLSELDLGGRTLPAYPAQVPWDRAERVGPMWPYAVVEGGGESYVEPAATRTSWMQAGDLGRGRLLVRVPRPGEVHGVLVVPNSAWTAMERRPFTIPAARAEAAAKDAFLRVRARRLETLASSFLPGGAWWRHQAQEAWRLLGEEEEAAERDVLPLVPPRVGDRSTDLEDTFSLFSGGRALSENLQLDRLLPEAVRGADEVDVASIEGITVAEMDWQALLGEAAPALDPLAALVPADQHALFFPSFAALARLADEAADFGAPVLAALTTEARDARTRARYEEQLCLSLDAWTRRLGGMAVTSVACTGSDPYLRTGSDVALLFEARNVGVLATFIRARQDAAREAVDDVTAVEGEVAGLPYTGVLSPTRRVCSYTAVTGNVVVVTNSLFQLRRIAETANDTATSLARLDEYRFFRSRYDRSDAEETALLVVPDAAIRRWCGPRWRIATSRRTRAAAALAELQATHLSALAAGVEDRRAIETRPGFPVLGNLYLTRDGVQAERYGTLDFQTPIAELDMPRVSRTEADLYGRWRDGYQRNWSGFFDPLALRFTVRDDEVGVDLSVLPLIANSDYREPIDLVGAAELDAESGDPHPGTIFHFAMALDPESETMRDFGNLVGDFARELGADPMSWIGGSVAVYLDRDPVWEDLLLAQDWDELQENVVVDPNEIPVVLRVEVASGLRLATFLTSLRAMIDGTSPDLLQWETREHGDRRYVRITSRDMTDDLELFYATLPEALLVSLREETLRRAMTREMEGNAAVDTASLTEVGPSTPPKPWLGRSAALDVNAQGLRMLQLLMDEDWSEEMRLLSWSNLPILNEWKRLFPDRDPVQVHEELWGERLVCPGGGEYVWNEAWGTMESTVCGHPGEPGEGSALPAALTGLRRAQLGLTFEHDGLRAAVRLERDS